MPTTAVPETAIPTEESATLSALSVVSDAMHSAACAAAINAIRGATRAAYPESAGLVLSYGDMGDSDHLNVLSLIDANGEPVSVEDDLELDAIVNDLGHIFRDEDEVAVWVDRQEVDTDDLNGNSYFRTYVIEKLDERHDLGDQLPTPEAIVAILTDDRARALGEVLRTRLRG